MKKAPEQLQHLERKHQLLERELDALASQPHLTQEQHLLVSALKKRKLLAKDSIMALRQAMAGA